MAHCINKSVYKIFRESWVRVGVASLVLWAPLFRQKYQDPFFATSGTFRKPFSWCRRPRSPDNFLQRSRWVIESIKLLSNSRKSLVQLRQRKKSRSLWVWRTADKWVISRGSVSQCSPLVSLSASLYPVQFSEEKKRVQSDSNGVAVRVDKELTSRW